MRKFVFLLFILIFSILVFSELTVFNKPPIDVVIDSVFFDIESRQLNVRSVLSNSQNSFYTNLNYEVALFFGDDLAKEGFLFEPLDYIISMEGKVPELNPNGLIVFDMNFVPPENIETGKYFFIVYLFDADGNPVGDDYTKNPIFMTGRGGIIPSLRGYFKSSNGYDSFLTGWSIEKTQTPQIIIPLNENPKFKEKVLKEKIITEVNVYSINFEKKLVYSYGKNTLKISEDDEKGQSFIYDLIPGEWLNAGPYEVEIKFFDMQGKLISKPVIARWLVDGFFSRIENIKSSTNYYLPLSPVDLEVELTSWTDYLKEKVKVTAILVGDGKEIKFEKEVLVNLEENSLIKFEEIIPFEIQVSEIIVLIEDEKNFLLDKKTFEFDNESKIISGNYFNPSDKNKLGENKPIGVSQNNELTILIALILILLIIFFGVIKIKNKVLKNEKR